MVVPFVNGPVVEFVVVVALAVVVVVDGWIQHGNKRGRVVAVVVVAFVDELEIERIIRKIVKFMKTQVSLNLSIMMTYKINSIQNKTDDQQLTHLTQIS